MATGLIVHLEIVPDQREAFVEIARAHGARSLRLESGRCLSFEVFVPVTSATQVILVEKYVDDDALQAHWDSPHMAEYSARVEAMITSRTRYRCLV
ncbi:MAG TPA: antibiotic biosynthesis monooxygenase [Chloroflexi bacterium]|nr:antibiotic biosynthesis monooxygenase [Chloroflexota bacterium]